MEKAELVTKIQELRRTVSDRQQELIKGTLKDTSSLKKAKRELASLLNKLNTVQHGA
ncbi:hypothetical protein IT418_04285 [bacterium]|nr:hypothetical protein [bacterium]